jgi:hypothetical protein
MSVNNFLKIILYFLYIGIMADFFKSPRKHLNKYGRAMISLKDVEDFHHLIGKDVNSIILFENGSDELLLSGATILPRHYYIFVGLKDGQMQFKPYEYDQYRIVVSTYKDIIISIDSIG